MAAVVVVAEEAKVAETGMKTTPMMWRLALFCLLVDVDLMAHAAGRAIFQGLAVSAELCTAKPATNKQGCSISGAFGKRLTASAAIQTQKADRLNCVPVGITTNAVLPTKRQQQLKQRRRSRQSWAKNQAGIGRIQVITIQNR